MFDVVLPNARHFKRCADCLRDVVHELTVRVTTDHICAHACAEQVVVEAIFLAERTLHFEVTQECQFGLSTDTLGKLLRSAAMDQKLRLSLDGTDVRFELFTERHASRFTMPTLDAPTQELPRPLEESMCRLSIRTEHFRSLLRDLRHVGERVAIEVAQDALILFGQSDNTTGEVVTRDVAIEGEQAAYGVYSIGLLHQFLKAQHVAPFVVLSFYPQRLKITLEANAILSLTLDELGGEL